MPFHWSRNSIPEFAHVPKGDRRRIFWEATKRCGWGWRLMVGPAAFMAIAGPTVFYYKDMAARLGLGSVGGFLLFAAGWLIGFAVMEHFTVWAALPHVRVLVGGLCVKCGYDLRHGPERCPECGVPNGAVVANGAD